MDILIIRFSSLGDIVLATGIVEALKRHIPESRLFFLTKAIYAQVFEHDDRIFKLVTVTGDEPISRIRAKFGPHTFDGVIDLHGSLRSRLAVMLISSRRTMRVKKNSLARRMMILTRNTYRRRFDVLGSYCETLKPLGIDERVLPRLVPPVEAVGKAEAMLTAQTGLRTGRLIGIAPGARHTTKRWNEESFAGLADAVAERGDHPVFIGDSDDLPVIERIRARMCMESVSFAGALELAGTIGMMSRLDCVVTNDSGPMHMAGALDIPVVALFGPTHPDLGFWPGYRRGVYIHTGIPCSPCSLHGSKPCRQGRRFCLDDITVGHVIKKIDEIMNMQ